MKNSERLLYAGFVGGFAGFAAFAVWFVVMLSLVGPPPLSVAPVIVIFPIIGIALAWPNAKRIKNWLEGGE